MLTETNSDKAFQLYNPDNLSFQTPCKICISVPAFFQGMHLFVGICMCSFRIFRKYRQESTFKRQNSMTLGLSLCITCIVHTTKFAYILQLFKLRTV